MPDRPAASTGTRPVAYNSYCNEFLLRLNADATGRLAYTGAEPHQALLAICSPAFGICRTTAGFSVAPTAQQLRHFVRQTWPELALHISDAGDVLDEASYYFVTPVDTPLTAWISTDGGHRNVYWLPISMRPETGIPCPLDSHVHVWRHQGDWGLFAIRSGPCPCPPNEPFITRALHAIEAAYCPSLSESSASDADALDSPAEVVPGLAVCYRALQTVSSGSASPILEVISVPLFLLLPPKR